MSITILGLVIATAGESGTRDTAATRPSAAAIVARSAAAISAATADSILQMIVTTPRGVTRDIIDDPGQATELVHNRAGGTMSESAIRALPGPARTYESRTVNFAAGTWSQAVLASAPDGPGPPGGPPIETPAGVIAGQLHHALGPAGHARLSHAPVTRARVVRATTFDGEPAYVLLLSGPGGPPARVWVSRSSWLPVQSASRGVSVGYEWTAQRTMDAASLWPSVPAGLVRSPST